MIISKKKENTTDRERNHLVTSTMRSSQREYNSLDNSMVHSDKIGGQKLSKNKKKRKRKDKLM